MMNLIERARENMIRTQIREEFVTDDQVIHAFKKIHRDHFVPEEYKHLAFADMQIPIGHHQVMFRPNDEARMLQALQITRQEQVLEIGTGTGYITALLALQAEHVDSIDIFEDFITQAEYHLQSMNMNNYQLHHMDATESLPNKTYDAIILTASTPLLPTFILKKLRKDGRMFVIIGEPPVKNAAIIDSAANVKQIFEIECPELIHAAQPERFKF